MHETNILTLALRLAKEAGDLIASQRKSLSLSYKNGSELVTQADVAADELITAAIRRNYPDHQILSEELNPDELAKAGQQEHLWIVDPIDGTVNFAHNHPQVAVSIAYYHNGKARVGVVHNPFLNETFHAQAGKGARLNDVPIHCSDKTDLGRSIIATGFPYEIDNLALLMRRLEHVLAHCADIRRLGSAALDICWVACGRLDGYYESVKPWDFAAAQLIAREAGACFGHIQALNEEMNPQLCGDNILISAPSLFKPLQALLADAGD
ncbi:MAG: inositol monophosphatase [Oceanospirillaceae bacterium]|jgi:myo-inositol-1(or 4)-monophosphatase|uniref:inositol monophosphatase family protein n=1 Tax=unclassified Thalassolituus TaxID=2624967 RepID=UPI000B66C0C0|nr:MULTISPECIES: inositol monophosphatase family protein [unclassified Thalassolituus]MAE34012.1 inositol monophosphatase [Oceanospirillaceae bacterium]OUX66824.1 MAG: inositol monophosphatase [Oceanospirillaceae bacterium TMED276]MBN59085.1 inositol monophosphatase [Oceanospirillaceae bacterium]MDQ4422898.1 inositol monophosphatase family protein [Thalassolituus sp.]MDQ4427150.1 inositol monophosphatase family protein [Thalassolituus sp.]|tara:strand:- start:10781 stop:11581 length:801 start_codon:yes stop_codon:yes gene_type:complete